MSRVGKAPIAVPTGTKVEISAKNQVKATGPLGTLSRDLNPEMVISEDAERLLVQRPSESKEHRSQHGLTRTLLNNMIVGVSTGFSKSLEIVGVGFRAEQKGEELQLRIGYSHLVTVTPYPGVKLTADAANRITVSGTSKEDVGQQAAEIRRVRPPDAYKGKGIRYAGEVVHLKPGKAGKAIGKK
jgi:large subunit ribosomal protein L6